MEYIIKATERYDKNTAKGRPDMQLTCHGGNLVVHRNRLAEYSAYIREILQINPKICNVKINIDHETVNLILDFIYRGEVQVNVAERNRIIAAFRFLKIQDFVVYAEDRRFNHLYSTGEWVASLNDGADDLPESDEETKQFYLPPPERTKAMKSKIPSSMYYL